MTTFELLNELPVDIIKSIRAIQSKSSGRTLGKRATK